MSHRTLLPLLPASLVLFALVAGCGKANPVAPSGSTVTLSAAPSEITSPTGTSTITAVVRKPNGTVAAGVDVRFTTTIGTIDVLKQTDSGGIATATLRGDGRTGTASVSAAVDGGATATGLMVPIGTPIGGGPKTILLEANPASINIPTGSNKSTSNLIAIVRDTTGQPVVGAAVTFSTNLGTLDSMGGFRHTNGSGEAKDTLTILPSDVTNQTSVMVTATVAAADGSLLNGMFTIALVNPNAATAITVSASPGSIKAGFTGPITLTATVLNAQGVGVKGATVIFSSTEGTINNPEATTDSNGSAVNTLNLTDTPANPSSFTVTAQVTGSGGALISGTFTITVNNGQ